MNYHPFVIPFVVGSLFLFAVLIFKYIRWFRRIEKSEQKKFWKTIFSWKIFPITGEIIMEGLFHRRIFKTNPVLGYMHSSFAFGWFMLIIAGTVESKLHSHQAFNAPYDPIFFKFFNQTIEGFPLVAELKFIMDFLLLYILTGVCLAWTKRMYKKLFGMKRTTKQAPVDRWALIFIWLIFPMRFLAESFTAGLYHNGGFLTQTAGNLFASFLPLNYLEVPAWWGYSIALLGFFVFLPFSRYMHIPTEICLIALRKAGLRTKKKYSGFSEFEVYSCSRCGICIDQCQVNQTLGRNEMLPVYYLRGLREEATSKPGTFECQMCGRCQEACPVGIDVNALRLTQRLGLTKVGGADFSYLKPQPVKSEKVLYFAGCMTHLTPTIKKSIKEIFRIAGVNFTFMDENGSICCGRPLQLSGKEIDAQKLIEANKKIIAESGATTLVTSCPICMKVFRDEYMLDIDVVHHSQFILSLVKQGSLPLHKSSSNVVYHDPCELGRGLKIYQEPRELIDFVANRQILANEKGKSLCCGNSIANLQTGSYEKAHITQNTLSQLTTLQPDAIITACPLCKKTFQPTSKIKVMDIAELVWSAAKTSEKEKTSAEESKILMT